MVDDGNRAIRGIRGIFDAPAGEDNHEAIMRRLDQILPMGVVARIRCHHRELCDTRHSVLFR